MELGYKAIKQINEHPFMSFGGSDFMMLWDTKDIHIIYERVIKSIAIREKVHWKKIYDFRNTSKYYTQLCVAILLIYDALKYQHFGDTNKDSVLHPKELEIVKSYYEAINNL